MPDDQAHLRSHSGPGSSDVFHGAPSQSVEVLVVFNVVVCSRKGDGETPTTVDVSAGELARLRCVSHHIEYSSWKKEEEEEEKNKKIPL